MKPQTPTDPREGGPQLPFSKEREDTNLAALLKGQKETESKPADDREMRLPDGTPAQVHEDGTITATGQIDILGKPEEGVVRVFFSSPKIRLNLSPAQAAKFAKQLHEQAAHVRRHAPKGKK